MRSYQGTGHLLHAGHDAGTVRYWVDVREATAQRIGEISGRVAGELNWFRLVGEDFVLVLQDGTRWECMLVNGSGRLANRGHKGLLATP